jgi:integral membrane protein
MSFITKFRIVGMIEGLSFIMLMGIAMPLKYLFSLPLAVKYLGWIHGILFILYCAMIFISLFKKLIGIKWAFISLIAALLPFGPFMIDSKLKSFEIS